jgi:HD superfamily phosphohydrolase
VKADRAFSLAEYPLLRRITEDLDAYLRDAYPDFFGPDASHPCLPLKPSKVVHDNIWGTNRFSWSEWVVADAPILQRLRDIKQVGLATLVYPSANHNRFEHSLGVLTLASKTFDALLDRHRSELRKIAAIVDVSSDPELVLRRLRAELRLAALLHDTGHSLFSHTSERAFSEISLLQEASKELTRIVGKEKGSGEVLSFCLTCTEALKDLLVRARGKLQNGREDEYNGPFDLANVGLIIVGRAAHPFLQFLGDIVSSAFDADKLDYLLRDASAAGLPLKYDLDRYLYSVKLGGDYTLDGDGALEVLYRSTGANADRRAADTHHRFPYYEQYRLRLPRAALNAIEQIVICKMMLFSYLYHHGKVRAAEGLLERMLLRAQKSWALEEKLTDTAILRRYLDATDSSLRGQYFAGSADPVVRTYAYRIINRLLPREVIRINANAATHADRTLLTRFMINFQKRAKRVETIAKFENALGHELRKLDNSLGATPAEALAKAGAWLDVPKAPSFADVDELTGGSNDSASSLELKQIFPVDTWTQAYTSYSYNVRVFAFSEYCSVVTEAARAVIEKLIGIQTEDFFTRIIRVR